MLACLLQPWQTSPACVSNTQAVSGASWPRLTGTCSWSLSSTSKLRMVSRKLVPWYSKVTTCCPANTCKHGEGLQFGLSDMA